MVELVSNWTQNSHAKQRIADDDHAQTEETSFKHVLMWLPLGILGGFRLRRTVMCSHQAGEGYHVIGAEAIGEATPSDLLIFTLY